MRATVTKSRSTGGTDSTAFNAAGLPGIGLLQDPIEYQSYTWHTNLDTYERVVEEDVKKSAAMIASAVYHLAMRDELLPRFGKAEMPEPVTAPRPATPTPTAPAATAPAAKLDINGVWTFTVMVDGAVSGTPTVTLKTDGEKVTGHYSSMTLGEADLTGTLKGAALEFSFSVPDAGDVIYKGTVENNNSIKGTLDIAGGAVAGTFTAKHKE